MIEFEFVTLRDGDDGLMRLEMEVWNEAAGG